MGRRSNHYDAAFESLLRQVRRPYVCVDEARRALFREESLKSMDFVVYSSKDHNLLVDVKGRRCSGSNRQWESWTMQEDVGSLMQWEQVFGGTFRGLFVFAYELTDPQQTVAHSMIWSLRGRKYAFYGVWARDYAEVMRVRSPGWRTVSLPARTYEQLRKPLFDWL